MAHLLIISTFEVCPKGGHISGPAIRSLEIARALRKYGHSVTLAQPHREPDPEDTPSGLTVRKWEKATLGKLAREMDACFVAHYIADEVFRRITDVPVVVDLFDPEFTALVDSTDLFSSPHEHFRQLNQVRVNLEAALAHADLLVCANERQKDYYLGMLTLAGRITPEVLAEQLIAVVPTGVPDDPPHPKEGLTLFRGTAIPSHWRIVLCPGGLYPWFDPAPILHAFQMVLSVHPETALVFVGAHNPISPKFSRKGVEGARKLAEEMNLLNRHVFFCPWLPYEDRGVMYLEADLAVICSRPLSETAYSFRTRIIDCLWGGMPIVCTEGDTLSLQIHEAGAGCAVPAGDPLALAAAVARFIEDDVQREHASKTARWLAESRYSWQKSVLPIHRFLSETQMHSQERNGRPLPTNRPTLVFQAKRQHRLLQQKIRWKQEARAAERKISRLRRRLSVASSLLRKLSLEAHGLRERAERAEATVTYLQSGRGWKVLRFYYRNRDRILGSVRWVRSLFRHLRTYGVLKTVRNIVTRSPFLPPMPDLVDQYRTQQKKRPRAESRRSELTEEASAWSYKPLVSLVTPVYDPDPSILAQTIESVRHQIYPNWELCMVDDGSTNPEIRAILEQAMAEDERIRCAFFEDNRGIAAASNAAIDLCTGEFVGFLDHDDLIEPDALWEVVHALQNEPDADIVYTDEDKIDETGEPVEVFFRPDWSPDLLMSTLYMVHLNVFRRSLLHRTGGFREGFTISQDYDLVLRATEKARKIVHIPKVLYHWRKHRSSRSHQQRAMEDTNQCSLRALEDALQRRGREGRVEPGVFFNFYRTRYRIQGRPLVSVIIPTRDRLHLLHKCLTSFRENTRWNHYELIVIDNRSAWETRIYLKQQDFRVLRAPYEFNFSRMMNEGAAAARGDFLLFMNNDMEIIEPEWMEALLEHAQREEIGAVGAKLLYPNGTIQHAGVVLGLSHNRVAGHIFQGFPGNSPGYLGYLNTVRNVSAVTAACMMTRRKLFLDMGGFELKLGVAFQDVDYCLRLQKAGYRIVYTPYACLVHHESASRGHNLDRHEEVNYMLQRWKHLIDNDPYYNPNLTLLRPDATLRV